MIHLMNLHLGYQVSLIPTLLPPLVRRLNTSCKMLRVMMNLPSCWVPDLLVPYLLDTELLNNYPKQTNPLL